ncbi:MAG TPA: Fe(3+) ABC transporter substrate-binding protein [Acidobacteriota bacterium]|nr:Fe(3+) ABC transporter substrate-binding protein [Acidobacteriota bacterium]
MINLFKSACLATLLLFLGACGDGRPAARGQQDDQPEEALVTVYSHRGFEADQELFQRFSERTGIEVRVERGGADDLIRRLQQEGLESPADILMTVDAGRLHRAKTEGLFQPVRSKVLEANIPVHLRDPAGEWFGLTKRARVIAYAREQVTPGQLSSYEDLADARWKGRILTGSADNIFTQSLLASIILVHARREAEAWARDVVANMAGPPPADDRGRIMALASGEADLALVNTYSLALMLKSGNPRETEAARAIGVVFPNQQDRGAHVNISGAGVARHAPHPGNAVRLLEFLSGEEAQRVFASSNCEYPVKEGVEWAEPLQEWGRFREDQLSLTVVGVYNAEAVEIMGEVGWP